MYRAKPSCLATTGADSPRTSNKCNYETEEEEQKERGDSRKQRHVRETNSFSYFFSWKNKWRTPNFHKSYGSKQEAPIIPSARPHADTDFLTAWFATKLNRLHSKDPIIKSPEQVWWQPRQTQDISQVVKATQRQSSKPSGLRPKDGEPKRWKRLLEIMWRMLGHSGERTPRRLIFHAVHVVDVYFVGVFLWGGIGIYICHLEKF